MYVKIDYNFLNVLILSSDKMSHPRSTEVIDII